MCKSIGNLGQPGLSIGENNIALKGSQHNGAKKHQSRNDDVAFTIYHGLLGSAKHIVQVRLG